MIRVVLVDDHELFRAGVRGELGTAIEVVGEAGSVTEAVPMIRELDPDVVLLDVHLPDGGGEAVIAAVAQERPGVKFLALSVSDAAEDVIGVIRAGARGYVTKTISSRELVTAMDQPGQGNLLVSPGGNQGTVLLVCIVIVVLVESNSMETPNIIHVGGTRLAARSGEFR